MQTYEQVLDVNTDINSVEAGLKEMGFTVKNLGTYLGFNNASGNSGSFQNGVLTSRQPIDAVILKQYIGLASVKAQVDHANKGKSARYKWTLKKVGTDPFEYKLIKP